MTVGSILRTKGSEVVTAAPDALIQDIVELLHARRIGAVLVIDGEQILGVVSERDIVRCLHERGPAILDARARDLMTSPVLTVTPNDTINQAMTLMTESRVRHLPVVDRGQLIGLVSIGDLVKRRIEEAEAEASALKDYIQHA